MRAALLVLLSLIAVLLLVLLAHLWQEPSRTEAISKNVSDQRTAIEKLEQSLRALEQQTTRLEADAAAQQRLHEIVERHLDLLEQLTQQGLSVRETPTATATTPNTPPTTTPSTTVAATVAPDGIPVLDRDFLLPYDSSHFDAAKVGGTFSEFETTPPGLNDIISNAANTRDVNNLVNDSLCSYDPVDPERWRGQLATSCRISDDWKTFTFSLRPGVHWQIPRLATDPAYAWLKQPVELTAGDFAFYVEMVQHPDVQCPQLKAYYEKIDAVTAPDPYTVVVRWKEAEYTNIAFSMGLNPLPRHIYTRRKDGTEMPAADIALAFNKHWFDEAFQLIGVGAYLLDDFAFDQHIVFRRNPNYWGKGLHFDSIRWDCATKDDTAQLVGFKNGQVQELRLTPTQYKTEIIDHADKRFAKPDPAQPKAGRSGKLAWERLIGNSYNYLGWNMRSELFKDRKVRWAMSHAFPRDRLIRDIWYDLGRPQVADIHPDSAYCNTDLVPIPFDLAKARELLAQAGWRDSNGDGLLDREIAGARKDFSFEIKYYANSPEWDRALAIYQEELRRIGIALQPKALEWPQLIQAYEDYDFEAVVGGWRMGLDKDFIQLWHSKYADEPKSSNHCGFRNAEADRIAESFRQTFALPERIRLAKEFQRILYEEQPYTFFRSSVSVLAWQNDGPDRVAGVEVGLERNSAFFKTQRQTWHLPGR